MFSEDVVRHVFEHCFALQPGESVAVLTDVPGAEAEQSLTAAQLVAMNDRAALAKQVAMAVEKYFPGNEVAYVPFPAVLQSGTEPGVQAAAALLNADVAWALTTFSLSHTRARDRACASGTRLATTAGVFPEMFFPGGSLSADYETIEARCIALQPYLAGVQTVRIATAAGTDFCFSLTGRVAMMDGGLYRTPGSWGNLPAGECFIAPVEGSARGVVVVEPSWYPQLWQPPLRETMEVVFEQGSVSAVRGGGEAGNYYRRLFGLDGEQNPAQRARSCLAEFAIGTNDKAHSRKANVEMEKILGTVHVAVGDNAGFGGVNESDFHRDFVQNKPSVWVDGRLLMDAGKHMVLNF